MTNGRVKERVLFKQLVCISMQTLKGPQCQEEEDSLFLMASHIALEIWNI